MSRTSTALSSATQHAMPPEHGSKCGTECPSTRFPTAYPAVCKIQREALKKIKIIIYIEKSLFQYHRGTIFFRFVLDYYFVNIVSDNLQIRFYFNIFYIAFVVFNSNVTQFRKSNVYCS